MSTDSSESAAGWDAIDKALDQIYGDLEPKHYGTIVKYMIGGPDPLDGISAYPVDEPVPHWHFVTYGLTELYEKESPRADVSGFGFELTLRLTREQGEMDPPGFALNVLQSLARCVFEAGEVFSSGHTLDLNGPIALARATEITAVMFTTDPDLPVIDTPHGRVEFIQVVGITRDELIAAEVWQKNSFLEILSRTLPKLVTDLAARGESQPNARALNFSSNRGAQTAGDSGIIEVCQRRFGGKGSLVARLDFCHGLLDRPSILEDEKSAREIGQRRAMEGSSTDAISASRMTVKRSGVVRRRFRWTLGASEALTIGLVLPGRVPFGRSLTIMCAGQAVLLLPGESNSVAMEGDQLKVALNAGGVRALAALLQPKRGEYHLEELPTLTIEIVPSEIRDAKGNVVETIG